MRSQLNKRSHRKHNSRNAPPRMSLERLEDRRLLATVTVNTALDVVDVPGSALISSLPGPDGVVSLREAIIATNNTSGADEIVFDELGVFAQPRTIALTQGVLSITRALTIRGPANGAVTISGQGLPAVFDIDDGSLGTDQPVSLDHLTITGGNGSGITSREDLSLGNCVVTGITGSAIHQTYGALNVASSTISHNSTYGVRAFGANISIANSTITGNGRVGVLGGTINGNDGPLSITSSVITDNGFSGGYSSVLSRGATTIVDSLIASNSGIRAGGIWQRDGSLNIVNSTIADNSGRNGGGVYVRDSTAVVSNSTISGNVASQAGGGIHNRYAALVLRNSTVTDNAAATNQGGGVWNFQGTNAALSSIISGNGQGDVQNDGGAFGFYSYGHNLIGIGNAASVFSMNDQTGVTDPGLKGLAFNGGLLPTHALLPNSPARDQGVNSLGLVYDQRGFPFQRAAGQGVDVGAFELQSSPILPLVVDTVADERDGDYSIGDLSLREAIELASGSDSSETITFDASGLFSSPQTITLELGELRISGGLTIDGNIANGLTVHANGGSRVLNIDDGLNTHYSAVGVYGFRITGGNALGTNNVDRSGGGIRNWEQLTLDSVSVEDNSADSGGGIFNLGLLDVRDSTISGNQADFGGGISNYYGELNVAESSLTSNTAANAGGGLYSYQGPFTISESTISGNVAGGGGGISTFSLYSVGLIANSTISGNTTGQNGGGILLGAGMLELRYMTITDNEAPNSRGSGMYVDVSFSSNLSLYGSIVSGNVNSDIDHEGYFVNRISSGGFNLIGSSDELAGFVASDLLGVTDPQLAPLANNGGSTVTHALLPGSPAFNAGDPSPLSPPNFDQRGAPFVRLADGRMDIGAVESQEEVVDGDFNNDGLFDCSDIDGLVAAIAVATHNPSFDLTGDGLVNLADRDAWLAEAGEVNLGIGRVYLLGDATLDGVVDGQDFIRWNTNKFTSGTGWCGGDFTADGVTDGQDFIVWNTNKFTSADTTTIITPVSIPRADHLRRMHVHHEGCWNQPNLQARPFDVTVSTSDPLTKVHLKQPLNTNELDAWHPTRGHTNESDDGRGMHNEIGDSLDAIFAEFGS